MVILEILKYYSHFKLFKTIWVILEVWEYIDYFRNFWGILVNFFKFLEYWGHFLKFEVIGSLGVF